jgi:hypothetical protein
VHPGAQPCEFDPKVGFFTLRFLLYTVDTATYPNTFVSWCPAFDPKVGFFTQSRLLYRDRTALHFGTLVLVPAFYEKEEYRTALRCGN